MTIDVCGCKIVAFSEEELAQAQVLEDVFSALASLRAGLAAGTLEVEFAKAFAVYGDDRAPREFTDGEPFFVMEVRKPHTEPEDDMPPITVRYFRGDMMNRGYDVISDMFTPK